MSLAQYYFIPTVREGLVAYLTASPAGRWAMVKAKASPSADGEPVPKDPPDTDDDPYTKDIALYGPGEILGFDASVVTRTDPRVNTGDYEPNFMPMVEFSEPDFPWRFTPAAAIDPQTSGRLTPWLTLIVLQAEGCEFKELGERLPAQDQKNSIPIRWIKDVKVSALPNLNYAWMWAHVQVTTESSLAELSDIELRNALAKTIGAPDESEGHTAARLICPRRLAPRTRYVAFVVPTFKLGVVAAGLAPLADGDNAVTLSWTKGAEERTKADERAIDLPYYYKWEFGTSLRGDFESLVRLLQPRELKNLGRRPMAVPVHPKGDGKEKQVLELEGALMSTDLEFATWRNDEFQQALAGLLNLPNALLTQGSETPPVVPPIFGRRHSGRSTVSTTNLTAWQNDVNLDPRQRAAAGFGALVVQKEQEALMAELWDQLGDIDQANELMRRGQLGVEASKGVFRRLQTLDQADFLWTAAPVFARVRAHVPTSTKPTTIARYLEAATIPSAAFDPAFRRVARRRGGIRKRQQRVPRPAVGQDLLSRLNNREIAAAGAPPNPDGMPSMFRVTEAAISTLEKQSEPERKAQGRFRLNGRVIDHRNRRGMAGLRVEAWDEDLIQRDMLGGATTNARGAFRIEFDIKYFGVVLRKARIDPNPDILFKIFRDKKPIRVAAPKILRNMAAGDTDVVIEAEPPAGSEQTLPYRVSGRVIDRSTRKGIPWVRVEAWDKDQLINDLVGSVVTDQDGAFHVEFERSAYKEWFLDGRVDLFFKVYQRDALVATTERGVMKALKPGDVGNVVVEIDGPVPPLAPPGGPNVSDFCEAAITCEALTAATAASDWKQLHKATVLAVCDALDEWLTPVAPSTDPRAPADLRAVQELVKSAIVPSVTIPARISSRVKIGSGAHQNGTLGRIESEVEFPQPMYEPLAAIS